jgi:hypothetical protein
MQVAIKLAKGNHKKASRNRSCQNRSIWRYRINGYERHRPVYLYQRWAFRNFYSPQYCGQPKRLRNCGLKKVAELRFRTFKICRPQFRHFLQSPTSRKGPNQKKHFNLNLSPPQKKNWFSIPCIVYGAIFFNISIIQHPQANDGQLFPFRCKIVQTYWHQSGKVSDQ